MHVLVLVRLLSSGIVLVRNSLRPLLPGEEVGGVETAGLLLALVLVVMIEDSEAGWISYMNPLASRMFLTV